MNTMTTMTTGTSGRTHQGIRAVVAMLALAAGLGGVREAAAAGCTPLQFDNPRPPVRVLPTPQTDVRNQYSRYTCTAFAALAGVEAAYKRAGYGDLDLSEEFANWLDKTSSLEWEFNKVPNAAARETQVAAFSGGGGAGRVEGMVAQRFRVPLETAMPYRSTEYFDDSTPGYRWWEPHWNTQWNASQFNLIATDPGRYGFPNALQGALDAPAYYGPASCSRITRPSDPTQLEAALAQGKPIVWDSTTAFFGGTHATLLIGYDRSSTDRSQWYFIAKNSWGRQGTDGYTRIPYDVIAGGYDAVTVDSVLAPSTWPELKALGRWNMSFDGHHGTLDIYHLPGLAQWIFEYHHMNIVDRRIGTFYEPNGNAYRVNGYISGSAITMYIDWSRPNLRYDELPATARRFTYYLAGTAEDGRQLMAGVHVDPDRSVWGGYAVKAITVAQQGQFLRAGSDPRGTWRPESYVGRFNLRTPTTRGLLTVSRRDDSRLAGSEVGTHAAFRATFRDDVTRRRSTVTVKVPLATPVVLRTEIGRELIQVRKLSHEAGVSAGATFMQGAVLTRAR